MVRTTNVVYNREDFESGYLCARCGGLLYSEPSGPLTNVCAVQTCPNSPADVKFIRNWAESDQPRLVQELEQEEKRIVDEISTWNHGALARYAHQARSELAGLLFQTGTLPSMRYWFAVGELLLLMNRQPPSSAVDDLDKFKALLEAVAVWSTHQRTVEDFRTRRYVLGRTGDQLRSFSLKFAGPLQESHRSLGIFSYADDYDRGSAFPYEQLEMEATPTADPKTATDARYLLDTLWPLSLGLRHVLQGHYRTSRQYDYRPTALDLSVIFGWYVSTGGIQGPPMVPAEKMDKELQDIQDHFEKQIPPGSPGSRTAQEFLSLYAESTELVPVVVRAPDGILLDQLTLLLFVIYLHGCPEPSGLTSRGEPVLVAMREKVGARFEVWIRKELRDRGYSGPDAAVQESFEYGVIAISEQTRTIILADAKYRDMAPSSYTGANLLNQELLGSGGLLEEADRQQRRLQHFRDNLSHFEQYLSPKRPWDEYQVRSFLVTKHVPLAHRYKETGIMRADVFLAQAPQ